MTDQNINPNKTTLSDPKNQGLALLSLLSEVKGYNLEVILTTVKRREYDPIAVGFAFSEVYKAHILNN